MPDFDSGALDAAGKRVVVVGGGDTAMDCVRTAVRQGAASVTCLYRRDRANMPGSMREVANAEEEGVVFDWLAAPRRLRSATRDGPSPACAPCACAWARPTPPGRQQVEPIDGSASSCRRDLVIKALGFDPEDLPALFGAPALAVTRWGTLKVRPPHHDDQPARRVRRRRHRARRLAGGLGHPRRPRRRRADPPLRRGEGGAALAVAAE